MISNWANEYDYEEDPAERQWRYTVKPEKGYDRDE